MPPRNPTLEDVPLPNVQGARPVASYDVSAWGQGAQSIAKGMQTLGGDIQKGAQDVAEVQLYRERQAVENGKIGLVTELINNRAQFEDSNHPNVKTQWDAANKASYDKYRAQIPAPAGTALADHFDAHADQLLAHENLLSTKRQRAVDSDFAVSDISSTLNTLRKSVKFNPGETPDATIDAAISGIHTKIDNAVARNLLTAEHGELLKQRSAKAVADQFVADMVENHPDEYKKLRGTWTPQAKTAKAFGTDPLRQSDSAASASTSAQQAPQDGAAPSLAPSTSRIAETVNNGETQNGRTINVRSLGQIARDTGGSKSCGFMGLNSASGSVADFVKEYGAKFGLRAQPGSAAFDAQWHAAALDQTDAFREAQLSYLQEKHVAPVAGDLTKLGIPAAVANDPRVQTYFADRHVQLDTIGLNSAATAAWKDAAGDVPRFLRNMNAIDGTPENLQKNFRSAIDSGVYGPEGHANRLQKRLSGALSAGDAGGRGAMPDDTGHPFFAMMDPVELLRFDTRANQIIQQRAADQAALNAQKSTQAAQRWDGILGQVGEGLAEVPPRDAIANDPSLDEGHRNQLLAHRAKLVKEMGREVTQSRADASADKEALYLRNILEVRSGRAELIPLDTIRADPELTEQHRNSILDKRQMEEKRLGSEVTTAQADDMEHRLINAQAGLGPMPAREEIEGNEALGSHRNHLLATYDKIVEGGNQFAQRQQAKIRQDPAAYAVGNVPVVADAWRTLQDARAGGGPAATAVDPMAAAQDYAAKTIGVQRYFGLSPHEMNLVPQAYIKDLALAVAHPEIEGGADKVAKRLEAEQKLWGPQLWPQVFRQISAEKGLPAVVRVVGSGLDELPGRKLLELSGKTFPEILRDESTERAGTVKSDVLKAMAPFMRSLAGSSDEIDVFNDFRGQAEKLAADYVVHGKTSSDAAAQAFKDLFGRYDFVDGGFGRDSFRIPKTQDDGSPNTFTSGEIQDGARWAKDHLGDLNVIPPPVAASGLSEPYRAAAAYSSYRRDAVWATASGDVGLRLVHNDETVRTKDDKPLVLTWDQLADMGRKLYPAGQPTGQPMPHQAAGRDFTSPWGPQPTEADVARMEREGAEATAQREAQIKSTAGALAGSRAQLEAVMTPGTPEREAAMQRARERDRADQLAELDRQEKLFKTRPVMRQYARDRELARIAAERAKLTGEK